MTNLETLARELAVLSVAMTRTQAVWKAENEITQAALKILQRVRDEALEDAAALSDKLYPIHPGAIRALKSRDTVVILEESAVISEEAFHALKGRKE